MGSDRRQRVETIDGYGDRQCPVGDRQVGCRAAVGRGGNTADRLRRARATALLKKAREKYYEIGKIAKGASGVVYL